MFHTLVYIVVIYIAVAVYNLWSSKIDVYTENEVFIFWHEVWLHFLSSLHIWLLSFTDIYWHSYSGSMLPYLLCVFSSYSKYYFSFFNYILKSQAEFQSTLTTRDCMWNFFTAILWLYVNVITMFHTLVYIVVLYIAVAVYNL